MDGSDAVEIKFDSIIHLIQQFCIENGLLKTFQQLEDESEVKYCTISNVDEFLLNFVEGKWDLVLESLEPLTLEPIKLMNLYEHIVLEMIECKEIGIAKSILLNSLPIQLMKSNNVERFDRLDQLLSEPAPSLHDLYGTSSKEQRRSELGGEILKLVAVVPPHRLLDLLKDSIGYQKQCGNIPTKYYDIFNGCCSSSLFKTDQIILRCVQTISNDSEVSLETVAFSPDGKQMAFGFASGAVEFWNPLTHCRRGDSILQQNNISPSFHSPVIALSFSHDNKLLAVGTQNGTLSLLNIATGEILISLANLHPQGITYIGWNEDSTKLLSTGYDSLAKIVGLKTFTTLRELRGHKTFVLSGTFSTNFKQILTGSADGIVKIWDTTSGECMMSLCPKKETPSCAFSIVSLIPIPQRANCFIVCTNDSSIFELSGKGKFKTIYSLDSGSFLGCCVSCRCEYVYAITTESRLLTIDILTGNILGKVHICNNELITIKMHPFMNVLVVSDVKGYIYFYEPEN